MIAWVLAAAAFAGADCRVERVALGRYEVVVSGERLGSGVLLKREDSQLLGGRWYRESLCLLSQAESWWLAADALRAAGRLEDALLAADEGIAVLGAARMRPPHAINLAMRTHHRATPGAPLEAVVAARLERLRGGLDRYAEAIQASSDEVILVVQPPAVPSTPPPPRPRLWPVDVEEDVAPSGASSVGV